METTCGVENSVIVCIGQLTDTESGSSTGARMLEAEEASFYLGLLVSLVRRCRVSKCAGRHKQSYNRLHSHWRER